MYRKINVSNDAADKISITKRHGERRKITGEAYLVIEHKLQSSGDTERREEVTI